MCACMCFTALMRIVVFKLNSAHFRLRFCCSFTSSVSSRPRSNPFRVQVCVFALIVFPWLLLCVTAWDCPFPLPVLLSPWSPFRLVLWCVSVSSPTLEYLLINSRYAHFSRSVPCSVSWLIPFLLIAFQLISWVHPWACWYRFPSFQSLLTVQPLSLPCPFASTLSVGLSSCTLSALCLCSLSSTDAISQVAILLS